MHARDMRALQYRCHDRRQGAIETLSGRGVFISAAERAADERLARRAREHREPKLVQFVELGKERIVFIKAFAEAEAGIEHQPFASNTCLYRRVRPLAQFVFDFGHDVRRGRLRAPFLGPSAGVHENHAAAKLGESGRHLRVPTQRAHVIHDLCPGLDRGAGDFSFVGVYGDDRAGALPQNVLNHRQHAL